jgi:integrase
MLTDKSIRALRPAAKPYKTFDDRGLYLLTQPNGRRLWRFKYRFAGREKLEAIGIYPETSLAEARERRDDLKRLLSRNIDPALERRQRKIAAAGSIGNAFEDLAREWFQKKSPGWVPKHSSKIIQRLDRDIFPWIGTRPIAELSAPEILSVLQRIEKRGAIETARRALGDISAIFRYSIAIGRAQVNPCPNLKDALTPASVTHLPAITDPKAIPGLMQALEGYKGGMVVRSALRLAPLLFVRPGELRSAKWADIDLDMAEWRFIASKTHQPHIVPLATQAVAILRELHPLTSRHDFVFPSTRSPLRPMSENSINAALRSLAIEQEVMCGHGFRAMARTVLEEYLKFPPHLIEAQLAHAVRDANGRAYNRTSHLEDRRTMMQSWADFLTLSIKK